MKKYFKRNLKTLERIFNFLDDFDRQVSLGNDTLRPIKICTEEVFTNYIKYNRDTENDILIELTREGASIIIRITDFDVEPFDPLSIPPYNVSAKTEERPVGGVGIHLLKKYMDDIRYEYTNKNSIITLIKHSGEHSAEHPHQRAK